MKTFKNFIANYEIMDELILTEKTGNIAEFAAQLKMSRRTIIKYLDFLIYDLKAPIYFDKTKNSFLYTTPGKIDFQFIRSIEEEMLILDVEKFITNYKDRESFKAVVESVLDQYK